MIVIRQYIKAERAKNRENEKRGSEQKHGRVNYESNQRKVKRGVE